MRIALALGFLQKTNQFNRRVIKRRVTKVSGLSRMNCGGIDPLCGPYRFFYGLHYARKQVIPVRIISSLTAQNRGRNPRPRPRNGPGFFASRSKYNTYPGDKMI